MSHSLGGAARLLFHRSTAAAPPPRETDVPALRPEAWRSWVAGERRAEVVGAGLGDTCRLADGREGRVAAVFDGQAWLLVCEASDSLASVPVT
jgi:hypothetical protein